MRKVLPLVLVLTVCLACGDEGPAVVEIDAQGAVAGVVWLDRNGNGQLDGTDSPIRDVRVEFVQGDDGEPVFTARSRAGGEFVATGVDVGDYLARVDSASAGDSVRVLRVDSGRVTVARNDTSVVLVGFTYPTLAVDTARRQPADTRLFVEGRALNSWSAFADSTVHVRDSTGAIRAVRLPPSAVAAGDQVRVQGTLSIRSGQPVLLNGPLFVVRTGVESPTPDTVDAATAASAGSGLLDADLIHLDSVVIEDTTRNAQGELIFTVEDASGTVEVLFDRDVAFAFTFPTDVIGNILDITGVLVPSTTTTGQWRVKPRENGDVVVGPLSYPILPVEDVRIEPADTRVQVEGLALNRWNVFGDSTLHVRDSTGALRTVRVTPVAVAAGDSVRLLGTTSTLEAQSVLRDVRTTVLTRGIASPSPDTVTTGTAALAAAGTLDAALVHLDSAVIQDTARTATGERVFIVGDGSGTVRVVLDRSIPFVLSFPTDVIGTIIEVTGLLVPSGPSGEWVVKPRSNQDIVVGGLSYPTVPVDTARQRPPETRLIVEGLALAGWGVFGDSTLHVADATGAIRALRVSPVAIAAGDSIQVVGTVTTAFGQPVLRDNRVTRLRTGVVSPPADSVSTDVAGSAETGLRDAALVRVAGATVQDTTRTADSDFVLEVDDGSGLLEVVLDRDIAFFIDPATIVGKTIRATGVLVPAEGRAGVWVLKPRRNSDLVVP